MKRLAFILTIILCFSAYADEKSDFEKFKERSEAKFNKFKTKSDEKFESFRKKANEKFAKMLKSDWVKFNLNKGKKQEDVTPTPPQPYNDEPIEDNSTPIQEVVIPPAPTPQPKPIEPIEEQPQYDEWMAFSFYGNELKVRLGNSHKFSMPNVSGTVIANTWQTLSSTKYNNVINDCLEIRNKYSLCDWAYLNMLHELANTFASKGSNEATMLMAYLYCQSGYKMRLGTHNNKLYMLYASKHSIYNASFYFIDRTQFYPFSFNGRDLTICQASFPNEQPLSLNMNELPKLGNNQSPKRELHSNRYKEANATISVNPYLIDFFKTYPSSEIDNNFMTRWAMYANAPLSDEAKNTLYPTMKLAIDGVSQLEAANRILNFVQTAFDYEYDNKVWGEDRAFFADETLFYPYSDCEDRSILFSRLIRDLLGLDVVLVYYPGHLATAVHFTTDVRGDNFTYDGKKFVICDPTYINALVGASMSQFRGCRDISVILLDK